MRKSLAIFCLGCVIGAAVAGGIFASLWRTAETARGEAEKGVREAEEQRRLAEEMRVEEARMQAELRRMRLEREEALRRAMLAPLEKETKRD